MQKIGFAEHAAHGAFPHGEGSVCVDPWRLKDRASEPAQPEKPVHRVGGRVLGIHVLFRSRLKEHVDVAVDGDEALGGGRHQQHAGLEALVQAPEGNLRAVQLDVFARVGFEDVLIPDECGGSTAAIGLAEVELIVMHGHALNPLRGGDDVIGRGGFAGEGGRVQLVFLRLVKLVADQPCLVAAVFILIPVGTVCLVFGVKLEFAHPQDAVAVAAVGGAGGDGDFLIKRTVGRSIQAEELLQRDAVDVITVSDEDVLLRHSNAAGMANVLAAIGILEMRLAHELAGGKVNGENDAADVLVGAVAGDDHPVLPGKIAQALRNKALRQARNEHGQFTCGIEVVVHINRLSTVGDGFLPVDKIAFRKCGAQQQTYGDSQREQTLHEYLPRFRNIVYVKHNIIACEMQVHTHRAFRLCSLFVCIYRP